MEKQDENLIVGIDEQFLRTFENASEHGSKIIAYAINRLAYDLTSMLHQYDDEVKKRAQTSYSAFELTLSYFKGAYDLVIDEEFKQLTEEERMVLKRTFEPQVVINSVMAQQVLQKANNNNEEA